MRRWWAGIFGLVVALASGPAPADAQSRTCRQVLPSDFRRVIGPSGQEIIYFRDPVRFLCTGDVLLESDSAVVDRAASTVELIGDVVYRDSTRELQADWSNYLGEMSQLLARGSAVLRDLETGAVIRGDQLNYLRETDTRPISRMIITGDRPYAVIPPRPDTGVAADTTGIQADTTGIQTDTASVATEVWADRMVLEGQDIFRADGDVEMVRGDMVGGGGSAVFDQSSDQMTLTEQAFVQTDAYRLDGDRIDAFLEGEGVREVQSRGSARVTSEELSVRAQRVRIALAEGRLERLEAWNPDTTATSRARASSPDFRLRADSIDALADSVGLRELRAVGRAYGERDVPVDTTAPGRSAPEPNLPGVMSSDWIQGDTILAFFERQAPAEIDPAADRPELDLELDPAGESADGDAAEVVLDRVVVVGGSGPALSLYRMAPDEGVTRPSINFMQASRIVLFMEQGEVGRVEAEGPIEGLYLDPAGEEAGGDEARPGAVGAEQEG